MKRIKDHHLNLVWVLTKGGGPAEPCLLAIGLDQVGLGEVGRWVGDAMARVRHVHQQGGGAQGLLLHCHGRTQRWKLSTISDLGTFW